MYQEFKCEFFRKARGTMAFLSLMLLATTLYVGWEETSFKAGGHSAVGQVVGFDEEFRNGRRYLFPIISYKDYQGEVHLSRSNLATVYGGVHKVGDAFDLIYSHQHPELIRENTLLGVFGKLVMVAMVTYLNFILLLIFHCYFSIGLMGMSSHRPFLLKT